jgi:hypothetical protein
VERDQAAVPSNAALEAMLLDDWLSCAGSVFSTDEVGITFTPAGAWFKLHIDGSGALVRAADAGGSGRWRTIDTTHVNGPGSYQLDLHDAQGRIVRSLPVFATEPPKMRVDGIGARKTDYMRRTPYPRLPEALHPATSPPAVLPGPAELQRLLERCTETAAAVPQPLAAATLGRAIAGAWVTCDSTSALGTREDGIELSDDGRFYTLHRASDGGLRRGAGFDETGSWQIVDGGRSGAQQLDLHVFGAGTINTHAELVSRPPGLRLYLQGGGAVHYVSAGL